MGLGRRRFVRHGASAALLALLFGSNLNGRARDDNPARRISGLLRDPAAARTVGRRYLAAYPHEADAPRLVATLLREAPSQDLTALRGHLATCRVNDFSNGNTVLVDGWVLAQSEARLCALAALVTT